MLITIFGSTATISFASGHIYDAELNNCIYTSGDRIMVTEDSKISFFTARFSITDGTTIDSQTEEISIGHKYVDDTYPFWQSASQYDDDALEEYLNKMLVNAKVAKGTPITVEENNLYTAKISISEQNYFGSLFREIKKQGVEIRIDDIGMIDQASINNSGKKVLSMCTTTLNKINDGEMSAQEVFELYLELIKNAKPEPKRTPVVQAPKQNSGSVPPVQPPKQNSGSVPPVQPPKQNSGSVPPVQPPKQNSGSVPPVQPPKQNSGSVPPVQPPKQNSGSVPPVQPPKQNNIDVPIPAAPSSRVAKQEGRDDDIFLSSLGDSVTSVRRSDTQSAPAKKKTDGIFAPPSARKSDSTEENNDDSESSGGFLSSIKTNVKDFFSTLVSPPSKKNDQELPGISGEETFDYDEKYPAADSSEDDSRSYYPASHRQATAHENQTIAQNRERNFAFLNEDEPADSVPLIIPESEPGFSAEEFNTFFGNNE